MAPDSLVVIAKERRGRKHMNVMQSLNHPMKTFFSMLRNSFSQGLGVEVVKNYFETNSNKF